MIRTTIGLIAIALLAGGCVTGRATQRAVIRAKDRVAPALVHVRPVKKVFTSGRRREVPIIGSGFIITPDGYVVTNEHVAGKSKYVRCVLWNKEEVEAVVVGVDLATDIAVLKLVTERRDLPTVRLGRSANLRAGQTVLALGSPHGLARSVSSGIVSVTNRNLEGMGSAVAPYNNWIQTDAAINPGNSGGPLVNLKGEVIGINTRKLSGADNVGFAIPIDIAKEVIDEIIEYGHATRSMIGIKLQEMTSITDDPAQKGVVIADVDPMSPAFRARLRPRDILIAVNGVPTSARFTEDLPAIRKLIADVPIGEEVILRILRNGREADFPVKTIEQSQFKGEETEFEEWGCTARELTPQDIRRAQLRSKKGVLITGTQVGSVAGNAKLKRGDIVLTLDEEEVENLAAFQEMYEALVDSRKRLILLTVKRNALTRFVLLKQEAKAEAEPRAEQQGGGQGDR